MFCFRLNQLKITLTDEDKKDAAVLQLNLAEVVSRISQRPSADNTKLDMTMKSLTITGMKIIVNARARVSRHQGEYFIVSSNIPLLVSHEPLIPALANVQN